MNGMKQTQTMNESFLKAAWMAGVAPAMPSECMSQVIHNEVRSWLQQYRVKGQRVWVIGAGKAAASMAMEVEHSLQDQYDINGMVITRHGHGAKTQCIRVVEAGHPVPDQAGQQGVADLIKLLKTIPQDEPILALVSGGGSSLLSVPASGLAFEDIRNTNRALLSSGAPIRDMNIVRKHITGSLGGQLAMLNRSPIFSLVISDVPGDDPYTVASGPFLSDDSTYAQAVNVVQSWSMNIPSSVMTHLEQGAKGNRLETPKSTDIRWSNVTHKVIASNRQSIERVEHCLTEAGWVVLSLGDGLEGEAKDVASVQAAIVREALSGQGGWPTRPFALISGGECTVTLTGDSSRARGGRNSEFLLSLVHQLKGIDAYAAIAGDSDGIDGSQDNAGAYWLPGDYQRLSVTYEHTYQALTEHDSYGFFQKHSRLLHTGPTLTNVNDIRIVLVNVNC